eukprot:531527-Hanusia_phi.AAC.1
MEPHIYYVGAPGLALQCRPGPRGVTRRRPGPGTGCRVTRDRTPGARSRSVLQLARSLKLTRRLSVTVRSHECGGRGARLALAARSKISTPFKCSE